MLDKGNFALQRQLTFRSCTSVGAPCLRQLTARLRNRSIPLAVFDSGRSDVQSEATLDELRAQLEAAVEAEDYGTAASLRDRVREMEAQDPLLALQAELEAAIQQERYGEAALLRDQIKDLLPPAPSTSSSQITDGIRVSVQSMFVPRQSHPNAHRYLFAYRVTITNEAHPQVVKLVSRKWIITDAAGNTQEVQGPGVVGEEPELAPGQTFEYTSVCPLRTPSGSMQGHYELYAKHEDAYTTSFLVDIAEFALSMEGPRVV